MAKTATYSLENDLGCGLVGAIFRPRGGFKLRKAASAPPLPSQSSNKIAGKHRVAADDSRKSQDMAILVSSKPAKPTPKLDGKRTLSASPRSSSSHGQPGKRDSDCSRNSTSSSEKERNKASQVVTLDYTKKLRKEPTFTSSDFSLSVAPHRTSDVSDTLYRASTGNVMLLGHLGNLKKQGNKKSSSNNNLNTAQKKEDNRGPVVASLIMGNIVKKPSDQNRQFGNLYSSMMNNLHPDVLKSMGNDKFKQGRLEEALALYNQAIALDSGKAAYYSNKSAALMGLGHLIEAVFECKKAIRIEPNYHNAHYRLAKLYLRLGEAEKALCHFKNSGRKVNGTDIAQAQDLRMRLSSCTEAQRMRDWNTLLKESQRALSSAADSAPQIYAMKAEALMKLHRHEEAYITIQTGPPFDSELCTRVFGSARCSYLQIIRSQVYMGAGRFEDAVAAAQNAASLDPSVEIIRIQKRVQAVTAARSNGNRLFKASKFPEASMVYTEGLELEPYNAILLCNRAACRSKLGQFEKAVEDCTTALNVNPSYNKARMRRADCNAKMERWEAAVQDYEVLVQEIPEDVEMKRALLEAKVQLHKQQNEGRRELKAILNMIPVSSYEHLKQFLNAPGISVVLFCSKSCYQQVLPFMEQVSESFPSVNFFKVDVEDSSHIAKSEAVSAIPAFKIYKKGSNLKDILGKDCESLESMVKLYSS